VIRWFFSFCRLRYSKRDTAKLAIGGKWFLFSDIASSFRVPLFGIDFFEYGFFLRQLFGIVFSWTEMEVV
jgi:hypothetical protein